MWELELENWRLIISHQVANWHFTQLAISHVNRTMHNRSGSPWDSSTQLSPTGYCRYWYKKIHKTLDFLHKLQFSRYHRSGRFSFLCCVIALSLLQCGHIIYTNIILLSMLCHHIKSPSIWSHYIHKYHWATALLIGTLCTLDVTYMNWKLGWIHCRNIDRMLWTENSLTILWGCVPGPLSWEGPSLVIKACGPLLRVPLNVQGSLPVDIPACLCWRANLSFHLLRLWEPFCSLW